ncbi:hypothetical protein HOF78_03535 [Candidatus Woesearchaeota archaeon]|nr:hypothetical protein [Candidatus Woesearchaeota archaeon]MBT6044532.1 hypothetical protein [Candidatus Woesearchaeota archaeon]
MADKPESLNVTHLHVPDQIAGQGEFIQPNVVDQYRDFLKEHQGLQLVGMLHNHPSNSSRSGTDIEQLGSLEGLLGEPMLGFVFCNTLLYQVELAKISLYETHLCSGDSDYSPTQSEMELWIKDKSSSKKFSCALGQILGVDLTDALHPREERKVPVVFDRRGRNLSPSNLRQILVPHYVERYMDNIDKNLEAFDSRGVAIPVQTVNDYKI